MIQDLADLHGKLRAEARQQVAHVVSEASKESAAACEQRLREAEAKVSGMAVRRLPLGYDRNGSRYWWIPMLDSFVLLEDSGIS